MRHWPLQGDSLLVTTKSPEISVTRLINFMFDIQLIMEFLKAPIFLLYINDLHDDAICNISVYADDFAGIEKRRLDPSWDPHIKPNQDLTKINRAN